MSNCLESSTVWHILLFDCMKSSKDGHIGCQMSTGGASRVGTARKLMQLLRDRAFARGSYPIYYINPLVQQEADGGVVVERASP